jgi:PIN domain nuclease of toxin-antitoxin system
MRLLLDTHLLIWIAADSARLPSKARELVSDTENDVFFSVASLWEIAIKSARGRDSFDLDAAGLRKELLENDFQETPILARHVFYTSRLPAIHRDPFDRLLVAQALQEDLTLLSSNAVVASYSAAIMLV